MDATSGVTTPHGSAPSPPAFQCGPRVFTFDDILTAAQALGELAPYRSGWLARQTAWRAAENAGRAPDGSAVEPALDAFRYARDLVSGEECERWLGERGLTSEDLVGCVTRRLLPEMPGAEPPPAPDPDDERLFRNDALLADEFNGWARHLARRVALAAESGHPLAGDSSLTVQWPELEAAFAAAAAAAVTPERRLRALAGYRLALTWVNFDLAEFDSENAAREAILCAREDGTTLRETADSNAFPCQTAECFLGDLPAASADLLTSARVGEVVSSRAEDGGIVVLSVISRSEPSLEDAAVCQRVDAALVEQHFRELEMRHIRWLINVEMTS